MIYRNSNNREIKLKIPAAGLTDIGTAEVVVFKDTDTVFEKTGIELDEDTSTFTFNLPFHLCQSDAEYDVEWSFVYKEGGEIYEYKQVVAESVITPILTLDKINSLVKEDEDWSEEDLIQLEVAVRTIIQAHTGQTFGKFVGSRSVTGGGEGSLRLPQRLISINNINGDPYVSQAIALRGGGWFLESKVWGVPTIRADFDGWHENPYTSPAPIRHPYQRNNHIFIKNYEYAIDGVWGWNAVPESVKEAARLLVNDYACGDSMYRDRFLSSISAADWRIQFHEGAFTSTGNARANQLLSEYVLRRGWVVV